jgi:hypothetical protein
VNSILIGFGHKKRRGKDTAVQSIIEGRGANVTYIPELKIKGLDIRRYAFADALKREVTSVVENLVTRNGMTPEEAHRLLCVQADEVMVSKGSQFRVQYEDTPDMSDPLLPYGKQRLLLQYWGGEFRRSQDPNYWVKRLRQVILAEQPQVALISDMRYLNEFNWIKAEGGDTVRIDRQGFFDEDQHQSEIELDHARYDYKILAHDGEVTEVKKCALIVFDMVMAEHIAPEIDLMELNAEADRNAQQTVSA